MLKEQEIVVAADEKAIVALSKKTKLNLPKGATLPERLTRLSVINSHHVLAETVKQHKEYKDDEGNMGSSAGGFMIQINTKIKFNLGKSVRDLVGIDEMLLARNMRDIAAFKIQQGERNRLRRSEIKEKVYGAIAAMGELFSSQQGVRS